jgi:hypothetical protein
VRSGGALVLVVLVAACSSSSLHVPDRPIGGSSRAPRVTPRVRSALLTWEQPSFPVDGLAAEPAVDTRALIRRLRAEGHGFGSVAAQLNSRQIPTPSGRGQWWAATVRQYLDPAAHAAAVAERRRRSGRT